MKPKPNFAENFEKFTDVGRSICELQNQKWGSERTRMDGMGPMKSNQISIVAKYFT